MPEDKIVQQVSTYSGIVSTWNISNERENLLFKLKSRGLTLKKKHIDELSFYSSPDIIEPYPHVLEFMTQGKSQIFEIQQKQCQS